MKVSCPNPLKIKKMIDPFLSPIIYIFFISVVDMMNGYQLVPSVMDEWNLHKTATKKFVRYSLSPNVVKLLQNVCSFAESTEQPYLQLQYDAKLRDAANVLSSVHNELDEAFNAAIGWLQDIVDSPCCSALCRAWSYYLLGSASLTLIRKTGDLHDRWSCSSRRIADPLRLVDARNYFTEALLLLGSSCDTLKRNVQRCLALSVGSGSMNDDEAMDCFCLVNSSVGSSVKTQFLSFATETSDNDQAEREEYIHLVKTFEALNYKPGDRTSSKWFLKELGKVVPPEWRFITAALSPTGELLLSSLEFSTFGEATYFNACVGQESLLDTELASSTDLFDSIVKPLNEIVGRSQHQLSEGGFLDHGVDTTKEDITRQWWQTRKQIDSDLKELLVNVESALLSSDDVRRVLLGNSMSNELDESADTCYDLPCGNLASRFEAAGRQSETKMTQQKSDELPEDLDSRNSSKPKMKVFCEKHSVGLTASYIKKDERPRQECIFLILDENLLIFPFEGLPCFDGKTICRLPSLPFALAKLSQYSNDGHPIRTFNPQRTSYIVDPESNLSGTKDRLTPYLDCIQSKFDFQWSREIGKIPSVDFMEHALLSDEGLLLYFGHGGGQQYFGRGKIESLMRHSDQSLSSVILMGCGSGKLESVNTKHSKSNKKQPIHYEPEGVALSYLLAGSPCVVGNLWDVTDRDIDRYAMALLESIFDNSSNIKSISQSVAEARQVCKMRYIVGCAPVCYGFPIIAAVE
jgi:Peptidase family C50